MLGGDEMEASSLAIGWLLPYSVHYWKRLWPYNVIWAVARPVAPTVAPLAPRRPVSIFSLVDVAIMPCSSNRWMWLGPLSPIIMCLLAFVGVPFEADCVCIRAGHIPLARAVLDGPMLLASLY